MALSHALYRGDVARLQNGLRHDLDSVIDRAERLPLAFKKQIAEDYKKLLEQQGYQGIKYQNNGVEAMGADNPESYIVFDPSKYLQNRLTGQFMSDSGAEGRIASQVAQSLDPKNAQFYSAAQRAIENASQGSATPEHWLGWLKMPPIVTGKLGKLCDPQLRSQT